MTHLARYDPSNFLGLYPGAVVELGLREVEGTPLALAATSTQVVLATTLGEDECSPFAELTTMDTVLLPTRYDEVRTGIADERPRLAVTGRPSRSLRHATMTSSSSQATRASGVPAGSSVTSRIGTA